MDVSDWYIVEFDPDIVRLSASPSGRQPWTQEFRWADIERICFKAEDFTASDGIYVFTNQRPESYAIPIKARGGQDLWDEMMRRGLFDAQVAVKAAASVSGLFCWPPLDFADDE
jgi:hypothetical protein